MAMTNKRLVLLVGAVLLAAGSCLFFLAGRRPAPVSPSAGRALIGHTGDPLLAFLYAATGQPDWRKEFSLAKFGTSADVGYALLAGEIEAGFMAPAKVLAIQNLPGFKRLAIVGGIVFPYGATLVIRKGLNLRLHDLTGYRIGASAKSCRLLHAFEQDATRLGLDVKTLNYEFLPFEAMIPALEAGKIDGAITKGSYAAIAQKFGHAILYQKWDMEAGDACCPAIVAQLEFLLLTQEKSRATAPLLRSLAAAEKLPPSELRTATAAAVNIPERVLADLPLATFQPADAKLLALFGEHADEDEEENEHQTEE